MIAYSYDEKGYYSGERTCQTDPLKRKRCSVSSLEICQTDICKRVWSTLTQKLCETYTFNV